MNIFEKLRFIRKDNKTEKDASSSRTYDQKVRNIRDIGIELSPDKSCSAACITASLILFFTLLVNSCGSPSNGNGQISIKEYTYEPLKTINAVSLNGELADLEYKAVQFSPYNPDSPEYMPEPRNRSEKGFCEMYDTASIYWNRLSEMCEKNNFRGADSLLNMEGILFHISMFLKHSSYRYDFLSQIYRPILLEIEEASEAERKYIEALKMEFEMGVASMAFGVEYGYVPESFAELITHLGSLLSKNGKIDEAFELIDDYAYAIHVQFQDPIYTNYYITILVAKFYEAAGDTLKAIDTIEDYIAYTQDNKNPQAEDEKYEYYIGQAGDKIKKLQEKLPLVYAK